MAEHRLQTSPQLGHLVQSARRAAGLSQAQLATRLGLSQSRVSKMEHDPSSIPFAQLLALVSALGLELSLRRREQGPGQAPASEW